MKKGFILLATLLLSANLFCGCKKGCRDAAATNFDEKAKINEGCVYYSSVQITSVKLVSYPNVNSSAVTWDNGDNPDCFIRLVDDVNQIMYQSDKFDNVGSEVSWTLNPALTLNVDDSFYINLRDHDSDFTDSGSDDMVEFFVGLSNYISYPGNVSDDASGKYPILLEVNEGGATIQVSLNWQL